MTKPKGVPKKPEPAVKKRPQYTSFYLDDTSRERLEELVEQTGLNRSELIRSLLNGADGLRLKRIRELLDELKTLLGK